MERTALCARLARGLAVFGIVCGAAAARAQVVLNEVDYDQPGTDAAEFIELRNSGSAAVSLAGFEVQLINGANGAAVPYTPRVTLPSVELAPGAVFVICANTATVPDCDLDVAPDTNLIQNGAPDAIALLRDGALVDALSYEGAVPGFSEGAAAAADDGTADGVGLSRCPDGADSNDNASDFDLVAVTPGAPNRCAPAAPVLGQCGDPALPISAIQGSGPTSPLAGQVAEVEAVVVGDFQADPLRGFFVQEEDDDADSDPATSEGLFVAAGPDLVDVPDGALVRVLGTIAESSSQTQLGSVSGIRICPATPLASAQPLAFPVAAVSDLERLEGMRVAIAQSLTVTGNFELGRFGSLDLSVGGRLFQPTQVVRPGADAIALADRNARSRIVLDDRSNVQNPNPIPYKDASNTRRVGDTLPGLAGILSGSFGVYRIQPIGPLAFASGNPRPAMPPPVGGRLRVAALNVLNYFTTLDLGDPVCGPTGGLDCRGANSVAELNRQREKVLNALQGLSADVVGLIELENNASASAADLVNGLNARLGAGTYVFVDTGTIGTDAIKVALLYRPARVRLAGAFAVLNSSVDPRFIDTLNRPSLAQTFEEVGTGARVTVIVNHLKSKGSACNDVGDPDTGDGAGNCNRTRNGAAQALLTWIASDPTRSGDPDFLVIGDLNAYAMEDPIRTLVAGGLESLIERIGADASSFQFQGQSGYLDHALSTRSLSAQVSGVAEWHINADEPVVLDYNTEFKTDDPFRIDDPFRTSDHDPVLVGLALAAPAPVVPTCNGFPATVYVKADGTIEGGPDRGMRYAGMLRGTGGADILVGTSGNDEITGRGGADVVCGEAGNDRLIGADGRDLLFGGAGNDEVLGRAGRDALSGGPGNDLCNGNAGNDTTDGTCETVREVP